VRVNPAFTLLNRVALEAASRGHPARHAHTGELLAALEHAPAERPR